MRPFSQLSLIAVTLLVFPLLALAAPPDAGMLLREELQRERPQQPAMPPKPEATPALVKPATENGTKVTVTAFKITGLTAISEAEAQAFLAPWLGQTHTLASLRGIGEKFEQWLKSRGLFVARAWIPPQDIKEGVVEIRVLEGRVEGIDLKLAPEMRLNEQLLRATVAGALPPDSALEQARLERGLLLANDLPAISARAVLAPGKEMGSSQVVVEAAQGPMVSGNVELDNTGSRYAGAYRLSSMLNFNDPYGFGDLWSLRATTSLDSTSVRAAWTTPIGSEGLKAGLSYIYSVYKLGHDDAISALELDGYASAVSGFTSYSLIRTRQKNLTASASLVRRTFVNRALDATTSDKLTDSLSLGINGDWSNMEGRGAYTTYSGQWTSGRLDLDGWAADKTQDAVTAQSQGNYNKFVGQLTHLQRIADNTAVYASLSGQMAMDNLDSSEKFSLGGPSGVRAYPTGEASGDTGAILTLELRHELNKEWRLSAFYDHGEIRLHNDPWANWDASTPTLSNSYALKGIGVTAVFSPKPDYQLTATAASRIGHNPARDTNNGQDSDNTLEHLRFWLQGSMTF